MLAVGDLPFRGLKPFDPRIKECTLWTCVAFATGELVKQSRDVTFYCSRVALSQLPRFLTFELFCLLGIHVLKSFIFGLGLPPSSAPQVRDFLEMSSKTFDFYTCVLLLKGFKGSKLEGLETVEVFEF
ncbi:hypothetical protein HanIR_Chr04g0198501 [Helianthus annuus]|nr:hypothetical protein HanIR_Chr04g0198501 [Helianthus annuus]